MTTQQETKQNANGQTTQPLDSDHPFTMIGVKGLMIMVMDRKASFFKKMDLPLSTPAKSQREITWNRNRLRSSERWKIDGRLYHPDQIFLHLLNSAHACNSGRKRIRKIPFCRTCTRIWITLWKLPRKTEQTPITQAQILWL